MAAILRRIKFCSLLNSTELLRKRTGVQNFVNINPSVWLHHGRILTHKEIFFAIPKKGETLVSLAYSMFVEEFGDPTKLKVIVKKSWLAFLSESESDQHIYGFAFTNSISTVKYFNPSKEKIILLQGKRS